RDASVVASGIECVFEILSHGPDVRRGTVRFPLVTPLFNRYLRKSCQYVLPVDGCEILFDVAIGDGCPTRAAGTEFHSGSGISRAVDGGDKADAAGGTDGEFIFIGGTESGVVGVVIRPDERALIGSLRVRTGGEGVAHGEIVQSAGNN